MKAERLFRVLGLVDPALVEEAAEARRRAVPWKRWGALAACLALAAGFGWVVSGGFGGYGSGMSSGSASGDGALPERPGWAGVMWYYGPVMPLTTVEDPAGLTAERTITWEMEPEGLRSERPWGEGTAVEDAYVLRNTTEEDITVTALYPFAGTFHDLGRLLGRLPTVAVDGGTVEAALYAGPGSGGYQSVSGLNVPYYTADLERLDDWEEYEIMLESGQYLEWALGEAPVLDMPVTVYEFSDFAAPLEEYPAATQAISFRIDPEETRIFTYGIDGLARDGDSLRYDYFVPDGVRHILDRKLLVVLGEDIGAYTLQGYQDGGCERGEELDSVSCTVTRRETTLDAVLDQLCTYHEEFYAKDQYPGVGDVFSVIPRELYRQAAGGLLYQYSLYPDAPVDRFVEGRLDDLLDEVMDQDRVLYLAFPVMVPAGGSVEVRCGSWKLASVAPACYDPALEGHQGYDLATRLGSSLDFTAQRAVLGNTEGFTLVEQDFGFDPDDGVTAVDLDLEQGHYHMMIRVEE